MGGRNGLSAPYYNDVWRSETVVQPPFVDITNDTFQANIGTPCSVAGTNNIDVVGNMWISNAANGQVASFPASQSWISPGVNLELFLNTIYVFGSNSLGAITNDTVSVVGVPRPIGSPFVDITNTVFQAYVDTPCHVAGTNNSDVVGDMWISNSANGQCLTFPATQSWVSAGVNIELFINTLYVFGSNALGVITNDTVMVVGATGPPGPPFVDITNDTFQALTTEPCSIAGTNNRYVVGAMWISNAANGNCLAFPDAQSWTSAGVNVELFINTIYVYGSNSLGAVTNDSVMVVGVPEPALAGVLAVLAILGRRRGRTELG